MPSTTHDPPPETGERLFILLQQIREAGRALAHFLALLTLTVILAVLRLLPFMVRVLTMLGWIVGMALAFQSAHDLFALLADEYSAFMAGLCAVVLCLAIPVAFFATERDRRDIVWGGFALAAAVAFGITGAMAGIRARPELYPIANSLPVVLAGTLLVFIAVKVRRINEHGR